MKRGVVIEPGCLGVGEGGDLGAEVGGGAPAEAVERLPEERQLVGGDRAEVDGVGREIGWIGEVAGVEQAVAGQPGEGDEQRLPAKADGAA
jgi:hypothetical protein